MNRRTALKSIAALPLVAITPVDPYVEMTRRLVDGRGRIIWSHTPFLAPEQVAYLRRHWGKKIDLAAGTPRPYS